MNDSANLQLPYIVSAQAQKHVTHNEALRMLDAIIHLSVLDRQTMVPPQSPSEGHRYIVAGPAENEWSGQEENVACWQDGAWMFYSPNPGWQAWVENEQSLLVWSGSDWINAQQAAAATLPQLGINTTADANTRIAIAANASRFSHDGSGHQLSINKQSPADTASVLLQSDWNGRAELGLTGDDDFHLKVSTDNVTWNEAIFVDNASANVGLGSSLPGAKLTIDALGQSTDGIAVSVDNGENFYQFNQPDGSNLLRAYWDGVNFHHFLDGAVYFNLNGNSYRFHGNNNANSTLRISGGASFRIDPNIDGSSNAINAGGGSYATASTLLTTNNLANIRTWAWNGSNGYTINSSATIGMMQNTPTGGDARVFLKNSLGEEIISINLLEERIGIGVVSPTVPLQVNGAVRIGVFTIATLPDASESGEGSIVYISDESDGETLAFSDGVYWRRFTDRNIVS